MTDLLCVGGHDHTLSLVEDLGDGRQAMECVVCDREFILYANGSLVRVDVRTWAEP